MNRINHTTYWNNYLYTISYFTHIIKSYSSHVQINANPSSILQANKLNIDVAIMLVHFQLPILLLTPTKKILQNETDVIQLDTLLEWAFPVLRGGPTYLVPGASIQGYFLKSKRIVGALHNYLTKTVSIRQKFGNKCFHPLRLNLSFTSSISQQQHPNDLLFPILNWKFKSYTTVYKYCIILLYTSIAYTTVYKYAFNME